MSMLHDQKFINKLKNILLNMSPCLSPIGALYIAWVISKTFPLMAIVSSLSFSPSLRVESYAF